MIQLAVIETKSFVNTLQERGYARLSKVFTDAEISFFRNTIDSYIANADNQTGLGFETLDNPSYCYYETE